MHGCRVCRNRVGPGLFVALLAAGVMAVNLEGAFLGTKYAINAMKPRGSGSIINVASVSGIKPGAGASAYCASKAAVQVFSKTAAVECADAETGIRVSTVTPVG